jgi:predicted N-acetyltransferase YhbS
MIAGSSSDNKNAGIISNTSIEATVIQRGLPCLIREQCKSAVNINISRFPPGSGVATTYATIPRLTMNIRTATPQDWPAIKEVLISAINDSTGSPYWQDLMDRNLILVAEQEGKVIGFGIFNDTNEEIDALYIAREHQGEDVGSVLLTQLEIVACNLGFRRVIIEAAFDSETFYAEKGYQPIGEVSPELGKRTIMEKNLAKTNLKT